MITDEEKRTKRKQRFLQEKKKHSTADNLVKANSSREFKLFFDKDGNITCLTQDENINPHSDWLTTTDIDQAFLKTLTEKDLTNYRVIKNKDNKYIVEVNPMLTLHTIEEKDKLKEIEISTCTDYDIAVSIEEDAITFRLGKSVKEKFDNVYPISATVKGKRLFKFFIVDPEGNFTIYHREHVSMVELLLNDVVIKPVKIDMRHCKIVTEMLFDKYVRQERNTL